VKSKKESPASDCKPKFEIPPQIPTAGEVFGDGTVIEVVREPATSELALLAWNGKETTIAGRIVHGGEQYVPPVIPVDIRRALRLPTRSAAFGSAQLLFCEIVEVLRRYTNQAEESVSLATHFILASWFSDLLPMAPCLLIFGPAESEAHSLLRILSCLCPRSLLLAELTPGSFSALPFYLRPTLLVVQHELRPRLERLLLASNSRGIHIPGNSELLDMFCTKALYSPALVPGSLLARGAILVSVSPALSTHPIFNEQAEKKVENELLPKLLGYRLANALQVKNSTFDVPHFTSPVRELARTLGAALEGDGELQSRLVALLDEQNEEARVEFCDLPESVTLEGLLFHCHQQKRDRVRVKELKKTVQTILVGRDEKLMLEERAIGARLKSLGLRTRSLGSAGRGLYLTKNVCRRVHELAQAYSVRALQDGKVGCPLCAELPGAEGGNRG
jgi:hypothetical protein